MKRKIGSIGMVCLLVCVIGICLMHAFRWNMQVQAETFTETAEELDNPNTGFYHIYGFFIKDDPTDYPAALKEKLKDDTCALAMMQINLQQYAQGALSDAAVENIRQLFAAMAQTDRTWIVRFLYDWNGENMQKEPQELAIITGHMKQVGPILRQYKDCIFTMQGLFVGNWGEMNGTRYTDRESLRTLAGVLAEVTDPSMFLSVRTPAQWRQITAQADPAANAGTLEGRFGLFNDGMLGNEGDYGTYGTQPKSKSGRYGYWTRSEELAFQNKLCMRVPNGGEVIADNVYNDLSNAIADFKTMHVTYLNEEYDKNVLDKWAASTVHTDDAFDGMDGLTYIRRHLGYRLSLSEATLSYDWFKDRLSVKLTIQNTGFAPVYKPCDGTLTVENEQGEIIDQEAIDPDFTNRNVQIKTTVSLRGQKGESFRVWFLLTDRASGRPIAFANAQERTTLGYPIGVLESRNVQGK